MRRTVDEKSRLSIATMIRKRRSAVVRMTGILYGLTLISMATVFAVSSAMQAVHYKDGDAKPIYLEVFQAYLYAASILMLFYIQIFACCQRRKMDDDGDGDGRDEQTIALKDDNKDDKRDSLLKIAPPTSTTATTSPSDNEAPSSPPLPPPPTMKSSHVAEFDDDVIVPGMTFDGDGVNLYLRVGMLVFGVGGMIQNGFQLAQIYQDGQLTFSCFSIIDLIVVSLQMTFIFFQAFCVFKLHKMVVRTHRGLFRCIYVHLIVTNLSMWLFATMHSIVKNLAPPQDNFTAIGNETLVECSFMRNLASKASPFLHPCSVQYALVGAMVVYKMYQQMNTPFVVDGCTSSSEGSHDGSGVAPAIGCDKTHKGLFLGILIVVLTIVAICCFFVFLNSDGHQSKLYATLIYFTFEYFLLALACLATLFSMLRLRKLSFVSSTSGRIFKAEKILLVFSYAGVVLLKGFYIVALATELSLYFRDSQKHGTGLDFEGFEETDKNLVKNPKLLMEILSTCSSGAVLFHAILQTKFIIDALNREVVTFRQRSQKPGRSTVAFLLLCNLSLFFTAIFEEERIETKFFYLVFFDNIAWRIISSITVPLLIFFRFLSVVCLLTVWKSTYFPRFGYKFDHD